MKYEKWLETMHNAWLKEWREERKERIARLHNRLVQVIIEEKAHLDDTIIALEVLRQEVLKAKMKQVESERPALKLSDENPTVIQ